VMPKVRAPASSSSRRGCMAHSLSLRDWMVQLGRRSGGASSSTFSGVKPNPSAAQSAYGQVAQRLHDGPGRAPSWRRVGMRTLHRVTKHEACELVAGRFEQVAHLGESG